MALATVENEIPKQTCISRWKSLRLRASFQPMGPEFTDNYLPIALQIVIAVGFAVSALLMSVAFGRSARRNKIKDSAYECGMLPVGEGQARFSVKFYLVAMLFVLFDIEVVFMYPWAVVFRDFVDAGNGPSIFWAMMGFVGILAVAYVYALKKGAFNWAEQR